MVDYRYGDFGNIYRLDHDFDSDYGGTYAYRAVWWCGVVRAKPQAALMV